MKEEVKNKLFSIYRKEIIPKSGLVVIKIGTRLITDENGNIKEKVIKNIIRDINSLKENYNFIIVSSGAIGLGRLILGTRKQQFSLKEKQALASIGQVKLMEIYSKLFNKFGINVAQVLITEGDIKDRKSFVNAQNTINTLLKWKVVPIVNENDTIATEEIKFGDNDKLSALVANMMGANILMILTTVDGFYGKDKNKPIPFINKIDQETFSLASGSSSFLSIGGMKTKLEAAKIMLEVGAITFIANGNKKNIVKRLLNGEECGTLFYNFQKEMSLRKRWIAFYSKSKGRIHIDEGAKKAITNNKSLLPSGILRIDGNFKEGEPISIFFKNKEIAKGISNYPSHILDKIKGKKTKEISKDLKNGFPDEVVGKDNLVIITKDEK